MLRNLLLLFIVINFAILSSHGHHCGIGTITTLLSKAFSSGCNREVLSNQCCKPHGECYDQTEWIFSRKYRNAAIHECDQKFKQCILDKCYTPDQTWCRNWIYFSHGKITEYFNTFCSWTLNIFCNR